MGNKNKYMLLCIASMLVSSPLVANKAAAEEASNDNFIPQNGKIIEAPLGYLSFCNKTPSECVLDNSKTPDEVRAEISNHLMQKMLSSANDGKIETSSTAQNEVENKYFKLFMMFNKNINNADNPKIVNDNHINDNQHIANNNIANNHANDNVIEWNIANKSLIEGLNFRVNKKIRPVPDIVQFNVSDYWFEPSAAHSDEGDCEDYALEKRKELIDAGISKKSMSIAIAKLSYGEYHAVLVLHTSQGDVVLDNLRNDVYSWKDAKFSWISLQSRQNPFEWIDLKQAS